MKKTIRRNTLNVLAVLVMLMTMLLTACSSGKTDAAPASEEKLSFLMMIHWLYIFQKKEEKLQGICFLTR